MANPGMRSVRAAAVTPAEFHILLALVDQPDTVVVMAQGRSAATGSPRAPTSRRRSPTART